MDIVYRVELTNDDDHDHIPLSIYNRLLYLWTKPQTTEEVETGTVTADTETGSNPTQQSADSHETISSVRQCVEQAEIPIINPLRPVCPFPSIQLANTWIILRNRAVQPFSLLFRLSHSRPGRCSSSTAQTSRP